MSGLQLTQGPQVFIKTKICSPIRRRKREGDCRPELAGRKMESIQMSAGREAEIRKGIKIKSPGTTAQNTPLPGQWRMEAQRPNHLERWVSLARPPVCASVCASVRAGRRPSIALAPCLSNLGTFMHGIPRGCL